MITYFIFAYKFGFPPKVVDEMNAIHVEAFKEMLDINAETMGSGGKNGLDDLFERGMI